MIYLSALYQKLVPKIHFVYLLYAVPMVLMAVFFTPPFQNPDEPNHYSRAEQVSRLDLTPVFKHDRSPVPHDNTAKSDSIFEPDRGGFKINKGLLDAADITAGIAGHKDIKMSDDMMTRSRAIKWGQDYGYWNSGNTAIYPPTGYVTPALAIVIGKFLDVSVVDTMYLSRLFNAALSVLLCFLALKIAKRSSVLMFIVLLFPMNIALCASISHDALIIACSFLFIAIIDRAELSTLPYSKQDVLLLVVLAIVIAAAKPPYILFAPVFLFLKLSNRQKIASVAAVGLAVFFWLGVNHANFGIRFAPPQLHINAKLQVKNIQQHPFSFMRMLVEPGWAQVKQVLQMIVGVLGWLDLSLPLFYYCVAYVILFMGVYLGFNRQRVDDIKLRAALIACALLSFIAILTAQYVTWTALNATFIDGMQGRYLLPICPLVLLALSFTNPLKTIKPVRVVMFALVILFPVYSIITLGHGLNKRYYCADNTKSTVSSQRALM